MADPRAAYTAAGVDVAAGDRAVELLRARIGASPDLLSGRAGFGAAIALPPGYAEPVLVTATDGVGTKTEIARALGRLDTIGQDLVAMCVDDIVCHGARPLFFLDYVAVGRVEPLAVAELVGGIARACEAVGCALVGGETAEHPGVMEPDAFDLAGFCVGIVERRDLIDGSAARAGDAVIGLASDGLHANGFSLVREMLARHALDLAAPFADAVAGDPGGAAPFADAVAGDLGEAAPSPLLSGRAASAASLAPADGPPGRTLGEVLLRPTPLYASHVLALRDELRARDLRLAGLAHITGGGLPANLPRAVADDLAVRVDPAAWPMPALLQHLGRVGDLSPRVLRAVFHGGIGMAAVVEPAAVPVALDLLGRRGVAAWHIGEVTAREAGADRYVEAGA